MRIGIVGHFGVVGDALYEAMYKRGHDVYGYDKANLITKLKNVEDTDVCFICVPTPSKAGSGECDTSVVEKTIENLVEVLDYRGVIVIRSTVSPGTTRRLIEKYEFADICYMPEFLKERQAVDDSINENYVIVGHTGAMENFYNLGDIYETVAFVKPEEAEFLKYFHNTFNALRVVFGNCFYEMTMKKGYVNYELMLEKYKELTGNSTDYLHVTNYMRGYAGPCLPKDVKAMASYASKQSNPVVRDIAELFHKIDSLNNRWPKTVPKGMRRE